MAETNSEQVEERLEEGEHKIVKEYIPVQELLRDLFDDANYAEKRRHTYPLYLTRIFDELTEIARVKCGPDMESFKKLMQDWKELEKRFEDLDSTTSRLEIREWRERKSALIRLRERLGMGTSPPDERRNLGPPLPMSAYYKCPEECPILVEIRKVRQRYQ